MARNTKSKAKPPASPRSVKRTGKQKVKGKAATKKPATQQEAPPMSLREPDAHSGAEVLDRLWSLIDSRKAANPETSHSARLLARGAPRIAQKLGEEATECVIEIMGGSREGLIGESADLLYHLLVAWVHGGLRPEEVWHELHRRERVSRRNKTPGGYAIRRLRDRAQLKTTKIP